MMQQWIANNFHILLPTMLFFLGVQLGAMFSRSALRRQKLKDQVYSLIMMLRAIWEQHPSLREFIESNDEYAKHFPPQRQYISGRWTRVKGE